MATAFTSARVSSGYRPPAQGHQIHKEPKSLPAGNAMRRRLGDPALTYRVLRSVVGA